MRSRTNSQSPHPTFNMSMASVAQSFQNKNVMLGMRNINTKNSPNSNNNLGHDTKTWVTTCRQMLIDMESKNIKTRAVFWTQFIKNVSFSDNAKMDLDTLFSKAYKLASKNITFITELQEFEQFMEDNACDIDTLKNNLEQIRDSYLLSRNHDHKNWKHALNVFNTITSILSSNNDNKLVSKKSYNKCNNFTNSLFVHKFNSSPRETQDDERIAQFRFCKKQCKRLYNAKFNKYKKYKHNNKYRYHRW